MGILVRNESGVWQRWLYNATVQRTWTTANCAYADGRTEEIEVPPYTAPQVFNGSQLQSFYDNGSWTLGEIEAVGGKIAVPFGVPEGYQVTSGERFEEDENGLVRQVFDVEEIPPPPEPPTADEKFDMFLAQIGMTKQEFMAQLT